MINYYNNNKFKRQNSRTMNALIGYVLLMTLMFSLAAGLYFGLKTIRLIQILSTISTDINRKFVFCRNKKFDINLKDGKHVKNIY